MVEAQLDALGDETAGAVATTSVAAPGVAGISLGTLAASTAVATIGIYGWTAGWFTVQDGGATGLDQGSEFTGWSPLLLQHPTWPTSYFPGSTDRIIVDEPSVDPFAWGDRSWVSFSTQWAWEVGPVPAASFGSVGMYGSVLCQDPAGHFGGWVRTGANGGANWNTHPGHPPVLSGVVPQTFPAGSCPEGTIASALIYGASFPDSESIPWDRANAAHMVEQIRDTGIYTVWVPDGAPTYVDPPPPGLGVVTRKVHCVGAAGYSIDVTDTFDADISHGGQFEVPSLLCPPRTVAGSGGVDWTPSGGSAQAIFPPTPTPAWVTSIPTEYPDCLNADCRLQLFKANPSPAATCGSLAVACPDWYLDPDRGNDFECHWGPYVVDTDRCSAFRDPGRVLPNATRGDDGLTHYIPWPVLELDSDVVATLRSRLEQRYDNDTDAACKALGEQVRLDRGPAPLAVPDVVYICADFDLPRALQFISDTGGAQGPAIAVATLAEAAGQAPKPPTFTPDCDQISSSGVCLDDNIFEDHLFGPGPQEDPEPEPLKTAANQCTALLQVASAATTRAQAQAQCADQPILFVGGRTDFGKEAAEHDLEVIAAHPQLVQLEYMSTANKRATGAQRYWYNLAAYNKPCEEKTSGLQECDEYPFFTSVEGGPSAFNTYGPAVLKPISYNDNQAEGNALRSMVNTTACGLKAQSAVGNPGTGGKKYLTIPLVEVNVPSFFVCPKV
ncbi:hypothetical protein [Cellulomonas sp. URHD0024]|uniref:NucA/NucB deoxyribonuclease domain-containing protein n=1 Tax=Cellulomonas sp. URHD0024 TaxID=1302620 RepID=UPI000403F320|nr:hypothetical protein [Cellulomonas sp. URHD0024]